MAKKKEEKRVVHDRSEKPSFDVFHKVCQQSGGVVSTIAGTFGVSRQTVYNWCKDKAYHDALKEGREVVLDLVESQLIKKAKRGDRTTLIFLAKTLGKSRGYIERQEVSGTNGGPIETNSGVDLHSLPLELRKQIYRHLESGNVDDNQ